MAEAAEILRHFSHEHALQYSKLPCKGNRICFGCKLTISPETFYYQCKDCSFSLHKVCYNMPKKVFHPAEPNHQLTLLAMHTSKDRPIGCEACGQNITGFCYNCATCNRFYHMLCLGMPLSVKIPTHIHSLNLEFEPPYDFQCDLCAGPSFVGWLYRCKLCEFDAHISCTVRKKGIHFLQQQSVPWIDSSDVDKREATEQFLKEIEGSGKISDNYHIPGHLQSLDDLTVISDDATIPSYQFSDACFSIDIAKSAQIDECINQTRREADHYQLWVPEYNRTTANHSITASNGTAVDSKHKAKARDVDKRPDSAFRGRNPKSRLSGASAEIGSHVWMELCRENEKGIENRSGDRKEFKDQTAKINPEKPKFSSCVKFLVCFGNPRR